jgi:hypothetical protein
MTFLNCRIAAKRYADEVIFSSIIYFQLARIIFNWLKESVSADLRMQRRYHKHCGLFYRECLLHIKIKTKWKL